MQRIALAQICRNALLQPPVDGVDVLFEPDFARVDPIPPVRANVIELFFDLAFDQGCALQEIVER